MKFKGWHFAVGGVVFLAAGFFAGRWYGVKKFRELVAGETAA